MNLMVYFGLTLCCPHARFKYGRPVLVRPFLFDWRRFCLDTIIFAVHAKRDSN